MTRITVFSSIKDVAKSLKESAKGIVIKEIVDEALGGYGGTVEFEPHRLSESTRNDLREAEILVTEPAVLAAILKHDSQAFLSLKWCQSTYAGVDPLFVPELKSIMPLPFALTRFAGKFGPPIAEWCIARVISHERQFLATARDQEQKAWAGTRTVTQYRYLSDLTMVVIGCGDIGLCIAKMGKSIGMTTVGYVRTPRETPESLDECTTNLGEALSNADYIVSVLPSTSSTKGFLEDKLSLCKKQPVFLNVGRGDVISEQSLLEALDNSHISAAILDVFPVEPLPESSPLWSHPKVTVSPHVSGITRGADVPDLVLENYQRYINDQPLLYAVDYEKGY